MKTEWNLDVLYKGLDDPAYEEDFAKLAEAEKEWHVLAESCPEKPTPESVEERILCLEKGQKLIIKLADYLSLSQAVNSADGAVMAQLNRLMALYSESAADTAAVNKFFGSIDDVKAFVKGNPLLEEYEFMLSETKREAKHLLSNAEEGIIAAMGMTGGSAWSKLQGYLTSTVEVDYKGGKTTLSEIRNLAYSADPEERKAAYEAELASYPKIAPSVAFALNNIKNQFRMLCEKRGYASPLDMTLEDSRMKRETLEALLEAIREYLPVFRKYLRAKASLLGHENGLPFYDLFAPVGSDERKFSLEEAKAYLIECFSELAPDIAGLMKEAFENEWIDFYPRSGKEGGAFCEGLYGLKQSRILTNYDGTFGAVDTLAHELGHAFHNRQLEGVRVLNSGYPMPVAETASTFNEVHLGSYAFRTAGEEQKLALLESDLRESVQCVVDIYSRFLFESAVFERSGGQFLMEDDLCEMMLDAQKQAYGDGLDPEFLHPYMWVCKSHYYGADLSFYNFPYAFGNLFATGLYGLYRKEGSSFMEKYRKMLRLTPTATCEEAGAAVGIDLTKKDFWESALQVIAEKIENYCALCEKAKS